MSSTLAIFTPKIGELSETFIKRHIDGIMSGQTVVVAGSRAQAKWTVTCPTLVLDELPAPRFAKVLYRAFLAKAGWKGTSDETKAVRRFLWQHNVKVAMGEYLNASLDWFPLCSELGVRFYAHGHGFDVSQLFRQDSWRSSFRSYQAAAGVITVNQIQRTRLISLGIDPNKIHVIPCGVEVSPDRPHSMAKPVSSYQDAGPNDSVIRCLCVGRMVAKKAPILCLDAFRRALEVVPHMRLHYVGTGSQLASARQFVQAFDLAGRVELMEGQPPVVVERLMKEADIYMQHSIIDPDTGDEEGVPVAILEAMANGLPVVSTQHTGIPEAVLHGETGYLVEEGDSRGMAQHIIELASNGSLRQRMGAEGWKRARDLFSLQAESARLRSAMGLE